MKPLELALEYLNIFFNTGNPDTLSQICQDDLQFEGPFYRYRTAEDYIAALKSDPPLQADFEIINQFETQSAACVVYKFTKPGVATTMAQLFEVRDGKIQRILLVFDSGAFQK